ncbi:MAG: hypothetical protein AB2A00_34370 [Myxococcota bacterium]
MTSKRLLSLGLLVFLGCTAGSATPPQQRESGPGGKEYVATDVDVILDDDDSEGFRLYLPRERPPGARFPVVVFLHGYQSMGIDYYRWWLTHLGRRGVVVIFPMYMERTTLPDVFARNAIKGIERALDRIHEDGISINTDQVAYVGHSGGGALAANLAVHSGRGIVPLKPRIVLTTAAGRCMYCTQMRDPGIPMENFADMPRDILLAVMAFSDDDVVGQELSRRIFLESSQIPGGRKIYLEAQSDEVGTPALKANHRAPASGSSESGDFVTDGVDWYGTWKMLDALMGCEFEGKWCDVALGNGDAQREMGTWSDGTPVARMKGPEDLDMDATSAQDPFQL